MKYNENIELRGRKLQLNGAGTRYKAVFKVYAAGLYLGKKAASTEEVLRDSGAKRISLTMLRIWLGPSPADWQLKDALLGLAQPN